MSRVIIDVREPFEFSMGHVDGAINMPPSKLMSGADVLKGIPKETEIILYCVTGSRSAVTASMIKAMGYNNVVNGINKSQVEAKYGA